ncbi:hypothetical protein AMATHDRAFT_136078 [Amanita thiersii Skay4041]|uniref:HIT domain-containing protein n=1 Tax=Amanita thiersii Skay4041 TaxID=703135 RepID=A0A2A9P065_9AGAR|nr:hypothetical protein AMATHDRAFT_136078 [Amanita thiersii Skay4041]
MTSFIIKAHVDRDPPPPWQLNSGCVFCKVIQNELPSHKVLEDDKIIVILDIMPLRLGHLLVIPKIHCTRLSELPAGYAAAAGVVLTKVANALTKAIDNTALNVVCNQEYAQAVPHVHFHVIPAPKLGAREATSVIPEMQQDQEKVRTPRTIREMHQMEFDSRDTLDDDDAKVLLDKIRAKL